MKYWVSVVSKEHALWGISGGYMQACHGKSAPLNRMKTGDYFMFYCPATVMKGTEKVQKFLGLGKVVDRPTYQFAMTETFHPYRRDIEFIPGSDKLESAVISELKELSVKSKFRFGFFDLTEADFIQIVRSMGLDSAQLLSGPMNTNTVVLTRPISSTSASEDLSDKKEDSFLAAAPSSRKTSAARSRPPVEGAFIAESKKARLHASKTSVPFD